MSNKNLQLFQAALDKILREQKVKKKKKKHKKKKVVSMSNFKKVLGCTYATEAIKRHARTISIGMYLSIFSIFLS